MATQTSNSKYASYWERPETFDFGELEKSATSSGRLWLSDLVNFLAFGSPNVPVTGSSDDHFVVRYYSAKRIFDAANAKHLTLVHSHLIGASPEPIDSGIFDFSYKLGDKENSIEPDRGAEVDLSDLVTSVIQTRYFNVRINLSEALLWLAELGFTRESKPSSVGAGRKIGTVKNPAELKVLHNLVQKYIENPQLCRLTSNMIAVAADEEDFAMPSQEKPLEAFEKRMRHHLMGYPDIAPRISKRLRAK